MMAGWCQEVDSRPMNPAGDRQKACIIVDDKAKNTNRSQRNDIKADLLAAWILTLGKHGYPPFTQDQVYKEIFEQTENFKKYARA